MFSNYFSEVNPSQEPLELPPLQGGGFLTWLWEACAKVLAVSPSSPANSQSLAPCSPSGKGNKWRVGFLPLSLYLFPSHPHLHKAVIT